MIKGMEPNNGVFYGSEYHQYPAFIQSVSVRLVIRAAAERERRMGKLARWLAVFGLTLE